MKIKCFSQEHNTLTWPGLEFRPLAPESSAPTIRKMVDFELDEDYKGERCFLVSSQVRTN